MHKGLLKRVNDVFNFFKFQDRKLLSSLLEVIAEPYKYFQYANSSSTMFPDSFIRLLRNKVLRFFT